MPINVSSSATAVAICPRALHRLGPFLQCPARLLPRSLDSEIRELLDRRERRASVRRDAPALVPDDRLGKVTDLGPGESECFRDRPTGAPEIPEGVFKISKPISLQVACCALVLTLHREPFELEDQRRRRRHAGKLL
jgi:hypothetical protein